MTGISDFDIAKTCIRLYADNAETDSFWDQIWPEDGGYAALKHLGDFDVVVWRGSTTSYDWALNFDAMPVIDGSLGMLHAGFVKGVWPLQDEITAALKASGRPVIVTGHSRGAAQGAIFAGHLVAAGLSPARLMVMGCPRPGYQKLADVLASGGVEIHSYKNCDDPITDVPFNIDLIGTACDFPYVHVSDFRHLEQAPAKLDKWGLFAAHHCELYVAGIQKYEKEHA